ncbi:hypothetical protein FDP41_006132 [Naegleria fowleri]|uniref:Uncharacterized protein n=1 Tax=Naegleria fowleri TaxID=5763 RepID=A0A6A5BKH7_NAEFO|nr:uncharacterized protein FDP41_006132 [Naegleria fowleri]KAF0974658.1 hypothetical protein FDP41_006132 [Naegleria fowleri]CAG4710249.1 unnamed protein product [Naegleria fowleri]
MPQHILPRRDLKDNSLESVVSYYEASHPVDPQKPKPLMWRYREEKDAVVCCIPIALILECMDDDHCGDESRYVLCGDFSQIPRHEYRPSHLLIGIQSRTYFMEMSFALLKLGKNGASLEMEENSNSRLCFLYDDSNRRSFQLSDEFDGIYIAHYDEKQVTFLANYEFTLMLNEQDVRKSKLHMIRGLNSLPIAYYRRWGERSLFRDNEGSFYRVMIRHHWIQVDGIKRSTELIRISTPTPTGPVTFQPVTCFNNEEIKFALLLQKNISSQQEGCKEFYAILSSQNSKREFSSIHRIYVPHNAPASQQVVHFTNFKKYFVNGKKNFNLKIISHCKLTSNKYLIMAHCKPRRNNITNVMSSFQQFFMDRVMWILIDLHTKHIKEVYPRVDKLKQKQQQPITDDFTTVPKRKRGGKFCISVQSEFEDGDLNGGYSNVTLLKHLKEVNNTNAFVNDNTIKQEEETEESNQYLIPPNVKLKDEVILKAFRPFSTNPDIFQVMVFFAVDKTFANQCGKMFRFFFKFKDECKSTLDQFCTHRFADISFKFL